MRINFMGWTAASTWQKPVRQIRKIDWTCDCGQHNINLGRFSGRFRCCGDRCTREYEIEIGAIADPAIEQ